MLGPVSWPPQTRIATAFGVLFVLLVVLLAASYFNMVRLIEGWNRVEHTDKVILQLELCMSSLKGAESAERGYVVTGNTSYLEPYHRAMNVISKGLVDLTQLTSNNAEQSKRAQALTTLVDTRLKELEETVKLRGSEGFEPAQRFILANSRKTMDQIRELAWEIRDVERQLLSQRREQSNHAVIVAILTLMALSCVTILICACLVYIMFRHVSEQKQAAEQIRELNIGLEKRVEERTAELKTAVETLQLEISQRQRAENELMNTAERLAASNDELAQFAGIASHDLQEPLRTIDGFVDLLLRRHSGNLDEEALQFISKMKDGTGRMQQLIQAILEHSRVDRKAQEPTETDSGKLIADLMQDLSEAIKESQAEVTFDPLPVVMTDKTQLYQLFKNLISNAIKFRREGIPPRIRLSAHPEGQYWLFTVTDNGIGIDEKYGDQVFRMFRRLHSRKQFPGTGIGLAVCKKIVERHGGKIWVESKEGDGSVFYFTLPGIAPE